MIRNVSHDGVLLETGEEYFPVGEVVNLDLPGARPPGEGRRMRALIVHSRTGYAGLWLDEKDDRTHMLMLRLCGHS